MSGVNSKASTLIGGHLNKSGIELVAFYLKAGENVGWKVMRKVNYMGRLDTCWQCGNDFVVEDDLGLKAVAYWKVQKGIGRCGEQQQERVLKKGKATGHQNGEGGNRAPASSNCGTVHRPAKHPPGPPGTPPSFEFRVRFRSRNPPDPLVLSLRSQ